MEDETCSVDDSRHVGTHRGSVVNAIRHRLQHRARESKILGDRSTASWAHVLAVALCLIGTFFGVAEAQTITEFSAGITAGAYPLGITAGPDGNLWFTEFADSANKIGRITPAGVVTEFDIPSGLAESTVITAGPDGNLWFIEWSYDGYNPKIGRIDPSTGVVTEFSGFRGLYGIAAGADGNLWFGQFDSINSITPLGVVNWYPALPASFSPPECITAGPNGNLWSTVGGVELSQGTMYRITTTGVITLFGTNINSGGGFPCIAAGSDGNLWFTGANVIGRITPAGVVTQFSAGISAGAEPYSIAAGPDGNLWFTELGTNSIGRITPAGVVTEFSAGITPGASPTGITAGPDGNIWFTEPGVNAIGRITIAGTPPPPPLSLSLIDPVPQYVDGAGITASLSRLASATQTVNGVSADGAAQIVVRVSGANVGDAITLTLLGANGYPTTDTCGEGYLGALPGGGSCSSAAGGSITITAENNGSNGSRSATAFAVYHAPLDFVRPDNAADSAAGTRTVSIQVVDNGSTTTKPVQIVRPLVVLVHGIWGGNGDWYGSNLNGVFEELQSSNLFTVRFGSYNSRIMVITSVPRYTSVPFLVSGNALGFMHGATTVLPEIQSEIVNYKNANHVAAVRADIVAHSMGGDVARTLPKVSGFLNKYNYNLGFVHKLITIGTPHQGTPLATELLQSSNGCVRWALSLYDLYAFTSVTPLFSAPINGGVGDLQAAQAATNTTPATPTSAAIVAIHNGSAIIPTAMIGAEMSPEQLATAGTGPIGWFLTHVCGTVARDPLALALTPSGWTGLLGASDGVVPLSSAFDGNSSYAQGLPFSIQNAIHNSPTKLLGFGPPSELDQASGVPADVLQLLNTPVSNSVFEAKP